ncbi:MAG TPA: 2,3-diphosphoglycerate-dependent phosphoglycerate mutase [Candidatus Tetragenococcus pullicola]|nr:2,3-diphosphoglycerate-dependent phosphoglycerate mutase [Candidatus Tetragenococcus pullicola]
MKLILLRHGESEANKNNIFTGWLDPNLTKKGISEAHEAGRHLAEMDIAIDQVYTSLQIRAIKTANILLEESQQLFVPIEKNWRLNERHYGALQGLNKVETAIEFGSEQVGLWRRSYDVQPPVADQQTLERRYKNLDPQMLPRTESLKDTLERILPLYEDKIVTDLKHQKNVLVVSHGNTLRALVKYLEGISDSDIDQLVITTANLFIYDFDSDMHLVHKYVNDFGRDYIEEVASECHRSN